MKQYRLLRERYFISTIAIAIILILFFTIPLLYVFIFQSYVIADENIGVYAGIVLGVILPIT